MSMQNAKQINQKEYLKKYLSGDKEKKKKRKEKKHKKAAKVKIIDDDAYEDDQGEMDEDLLMGGEDAPQIVGEYIEMDPNVRSKWRNIAVKDEPEEGERAESPPDPVRIKQEPLEQERWGRTANKMTTKGEFSSSRRSASPLPIKIKQEKLSPTRDSRTWDQSPPRRDHQSRETHSPHRRVPKLSPSSDQSPPRKRRDSLSSDQSPPRRKKSSKDHSPIRRGKKSGLTHRSRSSSAKRDTDQSPRRRRRSSDQSPSRKRKDQSPNRRKRCSPDRQSRTSRKDQSPPRKRKDQSPNRRKRRSSDQSPPRRGRKSSPSSDQSPPRRASRSPSPPPLRKSRWAKASPSLSPPPTHKPKSSRTLDGKTAGLQDAQSLKRETDERRRQEHHLFEQMSTELSGRHADVQMRSTGRRGRRAREAAQEDPVEQQRKELHEKRKKELYDRWGKGLKQLEDHKARQEEMAHEASKPVARYANDEDLDRHLREQEHADDPMLAYMRAKRQKREKQQNRPVMPKYEGSFPENRYGIPPGYRWDGVDRSNGYEQRWFDKQNERRAVQDEAYKYSVEDM